MPITYLAIYMVFMTHSLVQVVGKLNTVVGFLVKFADI